MAEPTAGRRIRPSRRAQADKPYPEVALNDHDRNRAHRFPSNNITTTKYTPLTFIPKNLFEQFRRVTNVYFLLIVIITLIPAISPLSPWTSIAPLVFVLGVSALKEGFEDFQRYRADRAVNNRRYTVVRRGGEEARKASRDIVVGDLILLPCDDLVPADILVLASSNADGSCFVETAQLDGETNLKPKQAAKSTLKLDPTGISQLHGTVRTLKPGPELEKWSGNLIIDGSDTSLDAENLLLRGMNLRNTEWIIGAVVFTGKNTKLSLNQKLPPSKFSTTERRLNKCVIGIFCFKIMCVIVVTILAGIFNNGDAKDAWYLDFDESAGYATVKNFFNYFALLSFLIPMSLMVTLEVVKVFQGTYMDWDKKMALDPDNTEETGAKAKTSNLNDELALVQYVFSDKTGTLTENCMIFRQCSINGTPYLRAGDGELRDELQGGCANSVYIREFLTNMAVCHNVETPELKDDGKYNFKAQSPDEKALCEGAETNGFVYYNRVPQQGVWYRDYAGKEQFLETPILFEFTSDRRRMSVFTKNPDKPGYRMYSKGADAMMAPRLAAGQEAVIAKTMDDIEQFSKEGLRTLILGFRDFTDEEFQAAYTDYLAAKSLMGEERDAKVGEVSDALERNLVLLGCTAIEDRLQKEVPETIHNLLRAGIRVWVITGDKQETAINIGYSCCLLKKNMNIIIINAKSDQECSDKLRGECQKYCDKKLDQELGLVIDGETLTWALDTQSEHFIKLAVLCHSVVCCRVTPIQKANIVALVKKHTKCISLAIGDGANDVSMIQEAHIGVGIFGKEGTQAARSADYAIREFRHLRRLLTVHGRWSFIRNSKLIQYFFYKNTAFFLVQLWFAFYCGYSGQTIYDDWIVTLYNIIFTSIPPFIYAVSEKDIDDDIIDEYPEAYRTVQSGQHLTYASVLAWMLVGIWHSLVFFFGPVFLVGQEPYIWNGQTTGLRTMGNYTSSIAVTVVILKLLTETFDWNGFVFLGAIFSIGIYWLVLLVESFIPNTIPHQYNQFVIVVENPNFWALFLWVATVCLLPDIILLYIRRQFFPDDWMILQEAKKYKRDIKSATSTEEEIPE